MLATTKEAHTIKNGALQITFSQWINHIHYKKHTGWTGKGIFVLSICFVYIFSFICVTFFSCLIFITQLFDILPRSRQVTKSSFSISYFFRLFDLFYKRIVFFTNRNWERSTIAKLEAYCCDSNDYSTVRFQSKVTRRS